MANDVKSLAHTKWNCKYRIVFAPKYRGKVFSEKRRYLKGKSSLMIYEQFADMKFKYRNREFWCRGYHVDTTGKNAGKKSRIH